MGMFDLLGNAANSLRGFASAASTLLTNKTSYQQNLATSSPQEEITTRGTLGRIANILKTDFQKGQSLFEQFQQFQTDPTTPFFNAYLKPTNPAVGYLADLGIDASVVDDNFFNKYDYLMDYLQYNGQTNTPSAPTKKSSIQEKQGYQIYQLHLAEEATKKAELQRDALIEDISYLANMKNRNYSDEEILGMIDWSKYGELNKIRESSASGESKYKPNEYNRAIDVSDDALYGYLYMARNPDYKGDLNGAMAKSYLGQDNTWKADDELRAKYDPASPEFSIFSTGSTMEKEMKYFGRDSFDQKWVDDHRSEYLNGNDETAKKYFRNVEKAVKDTADLKTSLTDMRKDVDYLVSRGWNAKDIAEEIQGNSDYNNLFQLDKDMFSCYWTKKDGWVNLTNTSEAIDYRWEDIEKEINSKCASRDNKPGPMALAMGLVSNSVHAVIEAARNVAVAPNTQQPNVPMPEDGIGQYGMGTIDLNSITPVQNEDGTISTVLSTSFYDEDTGKEILVPRVIDGKIVSEDEAVDHYYDTAAKGHPEYLGMFDTPEEATDYAIRLSSRQGDYYQPPEPEPQPVVPSVAVLARTPAPVFSETDMAIEEQTIKDMTDIEPTIQQVGTEAEKTAILTGKTSFFDACVAQLKDRVGDYKAEFANGSTTRVVNNYVKDYTITSDYKAHEDALNKAGEQLAEVMSEWTPLAEKKNSAKAIEGLNSEQIDRLFAYSSMPEGMDPTMDILMNGVDEGSEPRQTMIYDEAAEDFYVRVTGTPAWVSGETAESITSKVKGWINFLKDTPITQEEMAKFEELDARKNLLEEETKAEETYLSENHGDYVRAHRDQIFTQTGYNEAVKLSAQNGKPMDPGLFKKIEAVSDLGAKDTKVDHAAYNELDYNVKMEKTTKDEAAAQAVSDLNLVNTTYENVADTYAYLKQAGVQFSDASAKNIETHLRNLQNYSRNLGYVALDNNPDFDTKAKSGMEKAEHTIHGEAGLLANFRSTGKPTAILAAVNMDPERAVLLAEMEPQELDRYFYLYDRDEKEAKDYLDLLADPNNGMLAVRKMANMQENVREFASQPGLNPYLATGAGLVLGTFSWIPALAYRAGQAIKGEEVSEFNPAYSAMAFKDAAVQGSKDAIVASANQLFGKNSFVGGALTRLYDIGYGGGELAIGSISMNSLFKSLGVPLDSAISGLAKQPGLTAKVLKSAAEVLPTTFESAEEKHRSVLAQTNDEGKAGMMYNVSLLTGLITHSVVMNGLHSAYQADAAGVTSRLGNMFQKIISTDATVGASTLASSVINQYADKAIMKEDSQWQKNVDKYIKEHHYPVEAAEQMADQVMWENISNEVLGAVINSTLRTALMTGVGYLGEKVEAGARKMKELWQGVQQVYKDEFVNAKDQWAKVVEGAEKEGAFEVRQKGYDPETLKTWGKDQKDVPADMVGNQLGVTTVTDRTTGKTHNVIGYVDNGNGSVDFITTQGEHLPFANVVSPDENGQISGMNQREYGLLSEAYTWWYSERGAGMSAEAPAPSTAATGIAGYLPTSGNADQIAKSLDMINRIYDGNPPAAAVGIASLYPGKDTIGKAGGQTIVAAAGGDPKLASILMQQMVINTGDPADAASYLTAAALTKGNGNQVLRTIIGKLQNGESITAEDVNALHNGVIQDRQAEGYEEALQATVTENAVANRTIQLTAGNKKIKTAREAKKTAKEAVAKAEEKRDEAKKELTVAAQEGADAIDAVLENPNDNNNIAKQQQTGEAAAAKKKELERQEGEVQTAVANAKEADEALQSTQTAEMTASRVQAQTEVAQAQEETARAELEQALATYPATSAFSHAITARRVNENGLVLGPVDLTGVFAVTPDVTIYSTPNGYIMGTEVDIPSSALRADERGRESEHDRIINGWYSDRVARWNESDDPDFITQSHTGTNPVNPAVWLKHSLQAIDTITGKTVNIVGIEGTDADGNDVLVDASGGLHPIENVSFLDDRFTGENGEDSYFGMTADVDPTSLPETQYDAEQLTRDRIRRIGKESPTRLEYMMGEAESETFRNIRNKLLSGEPLTEDDVNALYETSQIRYALANRMEGNSINPDLVKGFSFDSKDDIAKIESQLPAKQVEEQHRIKEALDSQGSAVFDENGKVSYTGDVAQGKRLDLILGLAASGKSTIADRISAKYKSRFLDADQAKELHPLYMGGLNEDYVHLESKFINDQRTMEAAERGDNIIAQVLGENPESVAKRIQYFKDNGYEVHLHMTDLDKNKALGRALTRYLSTGRYHDFRHLMQADPEKINNTFNLLKGDESVDGYTKWSTDVPKDELPVLLESSSSDESDLFESAGSDLQRGTALQGSQQEGIAGDGNDASPGIHNGGSGGGISPLRVNNNPPTPTQQQNAKVRAKLKSPQEIAKNLQKDLGFTGYATNKFGNLSRQTRAFWDKHGKYIAVRPSELGRMNVTMHEIGHGIFSKLGITGTNDMIQKMINENPAFATAYTPAQLPDEAAAEFMWRYCESEQRARDFAGDAFYDNFEKALAADPKMYKAVMKASDEMRQWSEASTPDQLGSVIKYDKNPDKMSMDDLVSTIITRVVDRSAAAEGVNGVIREATDKNKVDFNENLRAHALLTNDAQKRAIVNLKDWLTDTDGTIIGDGLSKRMIANGFKPTDENIRTLDMYLACKVAVDREANGKTVFDEHITPAKRDAFINEIETTRPDIVGGAEAYWGFWKDFRQVWLIDQGFLSQEDADKMDAMYPYYAPTMRIQDAIETLGTGNGESKRYKVREAKGSTQDIFSPFYSMIGMVDQITSMALNNNAAKKFDELYNKYEGLGEFARRIPGPVQNPNAILRQQMAEVIGDKLDPDTMDQLFDLIKSKPIASRNEPNILTVYREDGSKVQYQVYDPYLYGLLAGVQTSDGHPVFQAIGQFTRMMSMLTTGANPFFSARNAVRDFQTSLNYGTWGTDYGTGLIKWLKTFVEVANGESKEYQDYMALGGGGWTKMDISNHKGVNDIRNEMFGMDTSDVVKKLKWLGVKAAETVTAERLNEIIEQTSRYIEYKYGKHDLSTPEGRKEAYLASRDVSVDFSRRGAGPEAYYLSKLVPFFGASTQGVYRTARQGTKQEREDVGRRLAKTVVNTAIMSALGMGLILLTGDDDLKKMYSLLSDDIKKNHLILPNPLRHVDEGASPFIRMPLEQDPVAYLTNWAVSNALWGGTQDETAIGLAALGDAILDNLNPVNGTVVQPFIDASRHRTYYGGSTIRSSQKDWTDPTVQYNEDTPEVFKFLGRAFNASPEDVEYIFQQYSGFIGQTVMPALTLDNNGNLGGLPAIGRTLSNQWTTDPTRSSSVLNDFYDMAGSLDTIKKVASANRPENLFRRSLTQDEVDQAYSEAETMLAKGGLVYETKQMVSDMYKEVDSINKNPDLSDSDKARLVREKKFEALKQVELVNEQLLDYYNKYMKDESLLDHARRVFEPGKYAHIPTPEDKMPDTFKADADNPNSTYMSRVMSVYNGPSGKDLGGGQAAALPHPSATFTLNTVDGKKEFSLTPEEQDMYNDVYKDVYSKYISGDYKKVEWSKKANEWDNLSDEDKYSLLKNAATYANQKMRDQYAKDHGIRLKK